MVTTKKVGWMPRRVITRNGERFVYYGDSSSGDANRKRIASDKKYITDQGRKALIIKDPNSPSTRCMYVSAKFYPSMCKELYPAFGKGTLLPSSDKKRRRGVW